MGCPQVTEQDGRAATNRGTGRCIDTFDGLVFSFASLAHARALAENSVVMAWAMQTYGGGGVCKCSHDLVGNAWLNMHICV